MSMNNKIDYKECFYKIRKLTLFIIVCLLGLTSCKISCSEFDEENLNWVPYQGNDLIELYSQLNDSTIIFTIKTVEITHTKSYQALSKCGGCSDHILIRQDEDDNLTFRIDIYLNENIITDQSYQIGDTYFFTYSEIKNFQFENEEYETVRIFERSGSKGTFEKLIIAKGIGIIGLTDINDNTWILRQHVNKSLNSTRANIVINNVSC